MFVNDDSVISYREAEKERNNEEKEESYYKVKSKEIKDSKRESEKVVYRDERGSHNSITSIKRNKEYSIKRNIIDCDKR